MEYWDIYDKDEKPTGRTMKRNDWCLKEGEYHLTVIGAVRRSDGRYLITKRVATKGWGAGWWEVSGGGCRAGETSAQAMKRELSEETGLVVDDMTQFYQFTYHRENPGQGDNYFVDVYLIQKDFDESDIHIQESEVADYRLATADEIREIADQGIFLHYDSIKKIFY